MTTRVLTVQQQRQTRPNSLTPLQRVVPAELLEQPTLRVPPLELLVGVSRTDFVPTARFSSEAGFQVDHRSGQRNDPDRDCTTIGQVVGFVTRLDVLFTVVCITSVRRARP